jgi:hypothetical protein
MVGCNAVHVNGLLGDAAEEVATADDNGNLAPRARDLRDLSGDLVDKNGVDTEPPASGQGFARDLEKHALVHSY